MNPVLPILKLVALLDVPLVVQLPQLMNLSEESIGYHQDINWEPDQAGGVYWLVESFLLRFPNFKAIYADGFIVLTETTYEQDLSTISFEKYSELLCVAEGTTKQWGIYFAKYFNCSVLINFLDMQTRIKVVMRPEDDLESTLENWEFKSGSLSFEVKQLRPRLVSLNCLALSP